MTPRGEIAHPRGANKSPDGWGVNPRSLRCQINRRNVTKISPFEWNGIDSFTEGTTENGGLKDPRDLT